MLLVISQEMLVTSQNDDSVAGDVTGSDGDCTGDVTSESGREQRQIGQHLLEMAVMVKACTRITNKILCTS